MSTMNTLLTVMMILLSLSTVQVHSFMNLYLTRSEMLRLLGKFDHFHPVHTFSSLFLGVSRSRKQQVSSFTFC